MRSKCLWCASIGKIHVIFVEGLAWIFSSSAGYRLGYHVASAFWRAQGALGIPYASRRGRWGLAALLPAAIRLPTPPSFSREGILQDLSRVYQERHQLQALPIRRPWVHVYTARLWVSIFCVLIEKLGVDPKTVQHGVEGLMYLITECSKLMVGALIFSLIALRVSMDVDRWVRLIF